MIGVLDYQVGNGEYLVKLLGRLGFNASLIVLPEELKNCSKVILPGVANTDYILKFMNEDSWKSELKHVKDSGKLILGICAGMQSLFESTEESSLPGLGLLKGNVKQIKTSISFPVPNMGWSELNSTDKPSSLLELSIKPKVYFNHSFAFFANPMFTTSVLSQNPSISASVEHENIIGLQFHPEKSADFGRAILKKFASI